jgi:hypothetical protein
LIKVVKKVATFSLLPNFGNYIRNPAKILASCQNFGTDAKISTMLKFGKIFFDIKVNRPDILGYGHLHLGLGQLSSEGRKRKETKEREGVR